jgi:hypothetical protein
MLTTPHSHLPTVIYPSPLPFGFLHRKTISPMRLLRCCLHIRASHPIRLRQRRCLIQVLHSRNEAGIQVDMFLLVTCYEPVVNRV